MRRRSVQKIPLESQIYKSLSIKKKCSIIFQSSQIQLKTPQSSTSPLFHLQSWALTITRDLESRCRSSSPSYKLSVTWEKIKNQRVVDASWASPKSTAQILMISLTPFAILLQVKMTSPRLMSKPTRWRENTRAKRVFCWHRARGKQSRCFRKLKSNTQRLQSSIRLRLSSPQPPP